MHGLVNVFPSVSIAMACGLDLGYGVSVSGFRVWCLGFWAWGVGLEGQGGSREGEREIVESFGAEVWTLTFRVSRIRVFEVRTAIAAAWEVRTDAANTC